MSSATKIEKLKSELKEAKKENKRLLKVLEEAFIVIADVGISFSSTTEGEKFLFQKAAATGKTLGDRTEEAYNKLQTLLKEYKQRT